MREDPLIFLSSFSIRRRDSFGDQRAGFSGHASLTAEAHAFLIFSHNRLDPYSQARFAYEYARFKSYSTPE